MAATKRIWDGTAWVTVDAITGEPVDTTPSKVGMAYSSATAQDDPFLGGSSYNDLKRADTAGAQRAAVVGGIGALGTAAQMGAQFIPTAADKENEKRLAEIEKTPGLTKARRAEIDEQAMRGVRALAGERMVRTGDALASTGNTSAAAIQRARESEASALNKAAIESSDIGIREEQAERARRETEKQERIAYQAGRANARISFVSQALGELMQATAPAIAAGVVGRGPTDKELLALQAKKNPDGTPMYPGLQGKTADEIRALAFEQWKNRGVSGMTPEQVRTYAAE